MNRRPITSGLSILIFFLFGSAAVSPVAGQTKRNARPLTAAAGEKWVIRWNRSDDFNAKAVDWRKWHQKPEQFSGWKWDNDRNVSVEDGYLKITARSESRATDEKKEEKEANEKKRERGYTSGMLKSYRKGTYGYYEAQIKGAPVFPGVCPAFWLYSAIDDKIILPGEVRYSEIDIVELTQRQAHKKGNERITDHNLHTILSNGKEGVPGREWRRPHDKRFLEAQANEYNAPFDPRLEFHTYGCRVDKKEIIWYVDGLEVGRKPNEFWHRPMNVALSLGLRAPLMIWQNNKLVVNEKTISKDFPMEMQVDYVRVWELENSKEQ